jgi:hypothetical protein
MKENATKREIIVLSIQLRVRKQLVIVIITLFPQV